MIKKLVRLLFVLTLVGQFASLGSLPAQAARDKEVYKNKGSYETSFSVWAICGELGERIDFTGTYRWMINRHELPNGRYHDVWMLTRHMTGATESGKEYILNDVHRGATNTPDGRPAYEFNSYVGKSQIIEKGSGQVSHIHTVIHVTVNAKGEMIVNFWKTNSSCD